MMRDFHAKPVWKRSIARLALAAIVATTVQVLPAPSPATAAVTGAPAAVKAINFGISQLTETIGSVYVGACSASRYGQTPRQLGHTSGVFWGECEGQSSYYQNIDTVGYDCSGFVWRMAKEAGIDLGAIDSSSDMERDLAHVDEAALRPGDLLVNGGTHVAMFIGDTNGDGVTEVIESAAWDTGQGMITSPDGVSHRNNWPGVRITSAQNYLADENYVGRRIPGMQDPPPPLPPATGNVTGWEFNSANDLYIVGNVDVVGFSNRIGIEVRLNGQLKAFSYSQPGTGMRPYSALATGAPWADAGEYCAYGISGQHRSLLGCRTWTRPVPNGSVTGFWTDPATGWLYLTGRVNLLGFENRVGIQTTVNGSDTPYMTYSTDDGPGTAGDSFRALAAKNPATRDGATFCALGLNIGSTWSLRGNLGCGVYHR